jgi:hypothetical protein
MSQILRRSALMSLVTFAAAIVALVVIGFLASTASADEPHEPIVGLWQITVKDPGGNFSDSVFSVWTSDGSEIDQDIAPILTGYVCYGTWIKLGELSMVLPIPSSISTEPLVFRTGLQGISTIRLLFRGTAKPLAARKTARLGSLDSIPMLEAGRHSGASRSRRLR